MKCVLNSQGEVGGGNYSWFQATGMIEWLLKSKPPKLPRASKKATKKSYTEFPSLTNVHKALTWYNTKNRLEIECLCLQLGYQGTTTNLQIVLNTQKSPYLKQANQKILTKCSDPKKYPNRKFQTLKNPSIVTVTWNPEYPLPRGGGGLKFSLICYCMWIS